MNNAPRLNMVTVFAFVFLAVLMSWNYVDTSNYDKAFAAGTISQELCGFAWGATNEGTPGTGTGWLSFNSKDCDTSPSGGDGLNDNSLCGSVGSPIPSYKVEIFGDPDSSGGSGSGLRGFAWSPNIGWVKFGNLQTNDFPQDFGPGDGTWRGNAELIANSGTLGTGVAPRTNLLGDFELRGWAQTCVGTSDRECGGSIRTDGWAGFLSLSNNRTNGPVKYHVGVSNGALSGYSWDPFVSGWLNWGSNGGNVRFCDVNLPDFSIRPVPTVVTVQPGVAFSRNVTVDLDTVSGADFPSSGVSLESSDEAGVDSSFNTTSCANSSCVSPIMTIDSETSVGIPDGESRTVTITGRANGPGGTTITRSAQVSVVTGQVVAPPIDCSLVEQRDYAVNEPVVINVNFSLPVPNPAPPGPYDVSVFGSSIGTRNAIPFTLTRTFTTIGVKEIPIRVTYPSGQSVDCNITVRVVVNPDIIER